MSHLPVILKLPFNISTRIRGDTKGGERAHTAIVAATTCSVGASWQRHGPLHRHGFLFVCERKGRSCGGWGDRAIGEKSTVTGQFNSRRLEAITRQIPSSGRRFLAADRQSVTSHRYVLPSCHRRGYSDEILRWHLVFDDAIRVIKIFGLDSLEGDMESWSICGWWSILINL